MFDHIRLIRLHELTQRNWELQVRSFVHVEHASRMELIDRLEQMRRWLVVTVKGPSALDLASDSQRLVMIGCELRHHGEQWLLAHPQWREWLQQQGQTMESAIAAEAADSRAEMSDPFWTAE